jgi:CDP-diacylglycerol--glycerol-3-phosphate 3-phosphatidyltransferase
MTTEGAHIREDSMSVGRALLGKFWTAANVLTLSRIVLAIPVAALILTRGPLLWIVLLTLLAAATDWLDGRVARWSNTVSGWGKVLDPLVDKIGGGAIVVSLVIRGGLPVWFVVVLLTRDLLIVLGGIILARRVGHLSSSMLAGKVAVTAVAITVLAALLEADPPVMRFCLVASTAFLGWSFLRYMGRYFRIFRIHRAKHRAETTHTSPESNVPGVDVQPATPPELAEAQEAGE